METRTTGMFKSLTGHFWKSDMKKVKLTLLIIISSIIFLPFDSFSQIDRELENTVFVILNAYLDKDTAILNEYINEEIGVYVLYRPGVLDKYERIVKIDFDNPVPEYFPYIEFDKFGEINYETLPKFSLETESWDKSGLYIDTTIIDNLLSRTAKNLVDYKEEEIKPELISKFEELESKSFKIILVDREVGEFIFYLTKLNGNWFLTIIDRVSTDTSA